MGYFREENEFKNVFLNEKNNLCITLLQWHKIVLRFSNFFFTVYRVCGAVFDGNLTPIGI
jgi:hypothetical protein